MIDRFVIVSMVMLLLLSMTVSATAMFETTPEFIKFLSHSGENHTIEFNTINKDDNNVTLIFMCMITDDTIIETMCDGVGIKKNNYDIAPSVIPDENELVIIVPEEELYGDIEKFNILVMNNDNNDSQIIPVEIIITPDLTGSPLRLIFGVSHIDFGELTTSARVVPMPNILIVLIYFGIFMILGGMIGMKKRWWLLLAPFILILSAFTLILLQRFWWFW